MAGLRIVVTGATGNVGTSVVHASVTPRTSPPSWASPADPRTARQRRPPGRTRTWDRTTPTWCRSSRARTPSSIWPGSSSPPTTPPRRGGPTSWAASGSSRPPPSPAYPRWSTRPRPRMSLGSAGLSGPRHPPVGRALTCIRSPWAPKRLRNSTGWSPALAKPWGVRVSNSAASPAVRTRSCSPRARCRRPERT
jgi:hypothetical protein